MRIYRTVLPLLMFVMGVVDLHSNDRDEFLQSLADDPVAVEKGKLTYKSICFSCHGHNLEGGTGFNLKDSIWVHGENPTDILKSVSDGFPEKGMIGFSSLFDQDTLDRLVAFLLSKQVGMRNVSYEIFHVEMGEDRIAPDLSSLKPAKTGTLPRNLIDHSLPEVKRFGISFSGDLIFPKGKTITMNVNHPKNDLIEMYINGEYVSNDKGIWGGSYTFDTPGSRFKLNYFNLNDKTRLEIELKGEGIREAGSELTMSRFQKSSVIVDSGTSPKVIRKKVQGIPEKSITVLNPEKTNYAFNPVSSTLVGAWYGGGLNIGPNVVGRGKDYSERVGTWLFKSKKGIALLIDGELPLWQFEKHTVGKRPVFVSIWGDLRLTVSAKNVGFNDIEFEYSLDNVGDRKVSLLLPETGTFSSEFGIIKAGELIVDQKDTARFSVKVSE